MTPPTSVLLRRDLGDSSTRLKCGDEFRSSANVSVTAVSSLLSGNAGAKGRAERLPLRGDRGGIRLVIAENHERIYKQNCQNLGLLTSTDFSVLERIARGEEIPLEEFTRGERHYPPDNRVRGFSVSTSRDSRAGLAASGHDSPRPMTLAEKIFARHFVTDLSKNQVGVEAVKPGDAGFVQTDIRFSHEYVTPMAAIFYENLVGDEPITDPSSVYFFQDHLTFLDDVMPPERKAMGLLDLAHQLVRKQEEFARKQNVRLHGAQKDRRGSEAICHSLVLENYALPGQIIIGSDSHTPHSGAVGCVAFGVGTTASSIPGSPKTFARSSP